MEARIDRRTLLRGAAAGAGALVVFREPLSALAEKPRPPFARDVAFTQGVASGEPSPQGITLWTRLEGLERRARVRIEVSPDPDFRRTLLRGQAVASPESDGTLHARIAGRRLKPGEQFFYRFATKDADSPVGRFRTARPPDSREPVRIAFFSCQEFIAGFYTAHADLAAQDDLDLVVCLGDYIYEQAFADELSPHLPVREDNTAPDGETQTLDEYRRKYSLHHTDENLLEVRRRHPLAVIWDDHEVEDNYAGEEPGGAAESRRVPFLERRANGYQAFFEYMPRLRSEVDRDRIFGSIPLGGAELFLLDTRQHRDDQPCNPGDSFFSNPCPASETDDPGRTLLGAEQKAWLKDALRASRAIWKIVANQVMIMSLDGPPRSPLNTDAWDGYAAERAELLDFIAAEGIEDVTFLTGDIHTFFAGNVTRSGRQALPGQAVLGVEDSPPDGPSRATEFVGGSITSPGIVDRVAATEPERVAAAAPVDALAIANNPHLVFINEAYKGYGLLEAGASDLAVDFRAARETREERSGVFTLRSFRVEKGRPVVEDRGGPLPLPPAVEPGAYPQGQLPPAGLSLGAGLP